MSAVIKSPVSKTDIDLKSRSESRVAMAVPLSTAAITITAFAPSVASTNNKAVTTLSPELERNRLVVDEHVRKFNIACEELEATLQALKAKNDDLERLLINHQHGIGFFEGHLYKDGNANASAYASQEESQRKFLALKVKRDKVCEELKKCLESLEKRLNKCLENAKIISSFATDLDGDADEINKQLLEILNRPRLVKTKIDTLFPHSLKDSSEKEPFELLTLRTLQFRQAISEFQGNLSIIRTTLRARLESSFGESQRFMRIFLHKFRGRLHGERLITMSESFQASSSLFFEHTRWMDTRLVKAGDDLENVLKKIKGIEDIDRELILLPGVDIPNRSYTIDLDAYINEAKGLKPIASSAALSANLASTSTVSTSMVASATPSVLAFSKDGKQALAPTSSTAHTVANTESTSTMVSIAPLIGRATAIPAKK